MASVALLLILAVRPIALRHLHPRLATSVTGAAALSARDGMVLERVDAQDGRVRLRGEVWSARSFDPDRSFEPGDTVDVVRIEGATAVVNQSELP